MLDAIPVQQISMISYCCLFEEHFTAIPLLASTVVKEMSCGSSTLNSKTGLKIRSFMYIASLQRLFSRLESENKQLTTEANFVLS